MSEESKPDISGILLVNKPRGKTAFSLVAALRRRIGVKKIGHAGTLDPFATGVMVLLVGKKFTTQSDRFLCQDKEYTAVVRFGASTDTFDCEGEILQKSEIVPTLQEIEQVIQKFQGEIEQVPPMYSAKKINGKKLYEYARKGQTIERAPIKINVHIEILNYSYPDLTIRVTASKGTYIRSLGHDIGQALGCGGHLIELQRSRSGCFHLEDCIDGNLLDSSQFDRSVFLESIQPA